MKSPNYKNIQNIVLERIQDRIWPPGSTIPSETELAAEFHCARATVNRALRELAETGVIDRKRKAGTKVALTPIRRARLDIPVTRREIEKKGYLYSFQILECQSKAVPKTIAYRMGLPPKKRQLLSIKTLHKAEDNPYVFEDRWLNTEDLPDFDLNLINSVSVNEWLVQNVAYSRGELNIQSQNADAEVAKHLKLEPKTAVLLVERMTWARDSPVTFVRLFYPPGHCLRSEI